MTDVVVCLGCNIGDRAGNMRDMERAVGRLLSPPIAASRLMETEPVGVSGPQPWYYNRLVRGKFDGTPRELLRACLAAEAALGRGRHEKNAPRIADIDIILFGTVQLKEPDLVIPHPRLFDRRFCIEGLREIAREWIIPPFSKRIGEIVQEGNRDLWDQQIRFIA